MKRAKRMNFVLPPPILVIHFPDGARSREDTCVVDQDIDGSKFLLCASGYLKYIAAVGYVTRNR